MFTARLGRGGGLRLSWLPFSECDARAGNATLPFSPSELHLWTVHVSAWDILWCGLDCVASCDKKVCFFSHVGLSLWNPLLRPLLMPSVWQSSFNIIIILPDWPSQCHQTAHSLSVPSVASNRVKDSLTWRELNMLRSFSEVNYLQWSSQWVESLCHQLPDCIFDLLIYSATNQWREKKKSGFFTSPLTRWGANDDGKWDFCNVNCAVKVFWLCVWALYFYF